MSKFVSIWELNTPTDLTIYDDIVFWTEVEKADGYMVKIDDKEYPVLTGAKFELSDINLDAGKHKVSVRALGSISVADNTIFRDSNYCKELEYSLNFNYRYLYGSSKSKGCFLDKLLNRIQN